MDAKAPQLQSPIEDQPPHQMVMGMSLSVFKYPRGFMKVLEFVFSIFAFATTCGFNNQFSFTVSKDFCHEGSLEQTHEYAYGYPFRLRTVPVTLCEGNGTKLLTGDFSSQSQYFVATGVLSFLFCLGIIVLYVFFDQLYRGNVNYPIMDFGLTVIMAVFWLTSSAAWSQGVADLKYFADPHNYAKNWCRPQVDCLSNIHSGNFSTLNVSLIFGYLNFGLWACNLWFLFKETPWFLARSGGPQPDNPQQHM